MTYLSVTYLRLAYGLPEIGRVDFRCVEDDGAEGGRHCELTDHYQRHRQNGQVVSTFCQHNHVISQRLTQCILSLKLSPSEACLSK